MASGVNVSKELIGKVPAGLCSAQDHGAGSRSLKHWVSHEQPAAPHKIKSQPVARHISVHIRQGTKMRSKQLMFRFQFFPGV